MEKPVNTDTFSSPPPLLIRKGPQAAQNQELPPGPRPEAQPLLARSARPLSVSDQHHGKLTKAL